MKSFFQLYCVFKDWNHPKVTLRLLIFYTSTFWRLGVSLAYSRLEAPIGGWKPPGSIENTSDFILHVFAGAKFSPCDDSRSNIFNTAGQIKTIAHLRQNYNKDKDNMSKHMDMEWLMQVVAILNFGFGPPSRHRI